MVHFGPDWFLGIDVAFQLLFTLITLIIAGFSYKLAGVAKNKNYYLFSAGFLLISAGYGVRVLVNFLTYYGLMPTVRFELDWMHFAGFYISSILFLGGLILLLSTTFKVRDIRPTIMLYLTSIIGFIFSTNRPIFLFIISCFFLAMIIYHHTKNFWHNANSTAFIVLIGFLLILLGQLNFLFRYNPLFYVGGHLSELAGYLILLIAIYKIARK